MTQSSVARRILHVSQPSDAGVAVVVRRLLVDQLARGWDVAVACAPEGDLADWAQTAGATAIDWRAHRAPGFSTIVETARLNAIVRDWQPDLVHLHSAKAGLAGRLALRGRICTVFQPHAWSFLAVTGTARRLAVRWERLAAGWADAVACVSEGERATAVDAGVDARFVSAPNGVDVAAFPPATAREREAARAEVGIAVSTPLAVCVGRLCRQKGQDVLLAAWPTVADAVGGAQLVLVGDGPDEDDVRKHAPASVHVVGATSNVRRWYAAADVVVQPSRWEAGAPLTVLEALATGRSVVVSDVPGAREVIGDDMGAICPPEDGLALADAVIARLTDGALAAAEGSVGARVVAERLALDVTNRRVAEIYEQMLAQRRGRARESTGRQPLSHRDETP